ncbi:MAG TPA: TonB-dependent receptor, partial [Burkholderiaceae bacterium]|nr:TonB-dependent receptor [Burkholderiaceae bacterium]
AGNEVYPTGYMAVPRLNPNINSYKGKVIANQTDLNLDFNTGSVRHQMVTGIELYEESYRKNPYSHMVPDFGGRRRAIDVRDPDTYYSGPWVEHNSTNRAGLLNRSDKSGAKVQNAGLYVYDQISLNEQWEIAAGLRYDHYRVKWYDHDGNVLPYRQKEGVWSGRLGVVYKPADNGSIYLSYSQATQPSAADAASRSGGGGDKHVANYSPGKAKTWELGTKWELLDEQLLFTAALFQVEKSNPTDTDPNDPSQTIQSGRKERVRGLELGLAGNITPKWSVYSGLALMDGGKILRDSDNPLQEGGKLKNVPKATFNLWTTYAFAPRWDASLGLQYVGKRRFYGGNVTHSPDGTVYSANVYAPSYWVANAALGYELNDNVTLRLNVNNIFNKFYLQQASASSDGFQLFGVPGAGRTIILNADLRF